MNSVGGDGPMKLALVIETFDPEGGGAERSAAQIVGELAGRGHEVTVIAGACRNPEGLPGVRIKAFAKERSSTLARLVLFARWARRQLAGGEFDASISITTAVPGTVLQPRGGMVRETLARNVAMRRGVWGRWVKRLTIALTPKYQVLLALERRTVNDPGVRKILAVSGYVAEQLRRHYGVSADRIEVLANASVMPQIDEGQRRLWRQQIRSAFSIDDDAVVYLFAAMNPRLKGFEPLLAALKRVVEKGVKAVVILAGEYVYGHQKRVAEMELGERVRFVRETRKMAALYAAADVTVLPTYYDPASKVVIESLMMGTPAISTAFNGASDFIAPATGGARGRVVADPGDVEGLAGAMLELADPAERAACRAATAGLAQELSMGQHVERLEAILRELAAAGGAGSGRAGPGGAEDPCEGGGAGE